MDVAEWQKRLEKHFIGNGHIGGHLTSIIKKEREYGQFVASTYHGQFALIDSFFSFYIEILQTANKIIEEQGWPKEYQHYAPTILLYVTNFRSFRAAKNLLILCIFDNSVLMASTQV